MRNAVLALALAVYSGGASAQPSDSTPMLMKPPFPAGLVQPKMHFDGTVPVSAAPPSAHLPKLCVLFDVTDKGAVQNLKIIQSTTVANVDQIIAAWWSKRIYDPAIINGKPIAVRMLGKYELNQNALPDSCNWDSVDLVTQSLKSR